MEVPNSTTGAGVAAAPRTVAGRRFVVVWCLSVALTVLVIFPLATLFLINWFDAGGLRWIKEIRERKFRMAEGIHSKDRILVVGGSSALFGVDAELLEKRLQRPVVNLASHAGLALRFLLEDARQAGRSGDTILLHIEYDLYLSDPVLNDIERQYCWTYEPRYLFRLPLPTFCQQLYGVPYAEYVRSWELWNRRLSGTLEKNRPAFWSGYPFVLLGPRGDFRGDAQPLAQIADADLENIHRITPTSRQLLEDFFSWARKRDIHVIGLFPAVKRSSEGKDTSDAFATIRSFYQSHQLPIVGDADLVQMPRELFLDTHYHPNSIGRRLHTEALARLLAPLLKQPISHEDQSVFLLCDIQKGAGPQDLSAAFPNCRYLTAQSLHHPYNITPAEVLELVKKGIPVHFASPAVAEMLQPLGLQSVIERQSISTLADWVKSYPNHYFLLSISGGAKAPAPSAELPASFVKFLEDKAPERAAILGTGFLSHIHKTQSGSGFVAVKEFTRSRLTRVAPMACSAAAWPITEDHPEARRFVIERQSIVDETAEGDLAVCVVDPIFEIVVRRGIFHQGRHLDGELRRVTAL